MERTDERMQRGAAALMRYLDLLGAHRTELVETIFNAQQRYLHAGEFPSGSKDSDAETRELLHHEAEEFSLDSLAAYSILTTLPKVRIRQT